MSGELVTELRHDSERFMIGHETRALELRAADSIEALEALCARLKLEAETHAQEARTQHAIVLDCYKAVNGGRAGLADWNGAEPVRARVEAMEAALRNIIKGAPVERPTRSEFGGNSDDDYDAGYDLGRWGSAEIARSALAARIGGK